MSLKRGSRVTELAVCGSSPHNKKKKKFHVLKRGNNKDRHRWELAAVSARLGKGEEKGRAVFAVLLLRWVEAEPLRREK